MLRAATAVFTSSTGNYQADPSDVSQTPPMIVKTERKP